MKFLIIILALALGGVKTGFVFKLKKSTEGSIYKDLDLHQMKDSDLNLVFTVNGFVGNPPNENQFVLDTSKNVSYSPCVKVTINADKANYSPYRKVYLY